MIEFKPKDTDLVLEKRPRWSKVYDKLEEVRSIVFKDEEEQINEFVEFDSLYHFIDSIEQQYEKHGLRDVLRSSRSGLNGDFCYNGGTPKQKRWTYGTEFRDRISTRDALMSSEVPENMWIIIDKLKNSLLALEEVKRLIDMAPSIKKLKKFGASGDDLDIDRVLCGDPNHWQYSTKGKKTNVIRIGLNIAMSCNNKEDKFLKIVALAAVAADLVIKAGCSLEFILCGLSTEVQVEGNNPYLNPEGDAIGNLEDGFSGSIFTIKKAEEPFDLARIACLGIPGLFRHYMFAARAAYLSSSVTPGMGVSKPVPEEMYDRIGLKHVIGYRLVTGSNNSLNQRIFLRGIFEEIAGIRVPKNSY